MELLKTSKVTGYMWEQQNYDPKNGLANPKES